MRAVTDQTIQIMSDIIESTYGNHNDRVDYKMEKGICTGRGLFNIPDVSVQQAFMSEGSIFADHTHEEFEIIAIYKGRLRIEFDDFIRVVGKGDVAYIEPNMRHRCYALEDTAMIGITIPQSKDYPNARIRDEH